MKISENFDIRELVHWRTWRKYGNRSIEQVDNRLPSILEYLKKAFSTDGERAYVVVNDWLWGGHYTDSGYRDPDSKVGAPESQHRSGRAVDIKVKHKGEYLSSEDMYRVVRENWHELKKLGVKRVEDPAYTKNEGGRAWLHIDLAETNKDELHVFKP